MNERGGNNARLCWKRRLLNRDNSRELIATAKESVGNVDNSRGLLHQRGPIASGMSMSDGGTRLRQVERQRQEGDSGKGGNMHEV